MITESCGLLHAAHDDDRIFDMVDYLNLRQVAKTH